jgi:hypothetical protein
LDLSQQLKKIITTLEEKVTQNEFIEALKIKADGDWVKDQLSYKAGKTQVAHALKQKASSSDVEKLEKQFQDVCNIIVCTHFKYSTYIM